MSENSRHYEADDLRREEDRRKRPDVQRYKPGAFTSRRQEPEELIPGATYKGGRKNGGNNGSKHDRPKPEGKDKSAPVDMSNADKKNKKPEIEHYIPKKSNTTEGGEGDGRVEKKETGGGGSFRKNKKRKGKNREQLPETDSNLPAAAQLEDKKNPSQPINNAGQSTLPKEKEAAKNKVNTSNEAAGGGNGGPAKKKIEPLLSPKKSDDINLRKVNSDRKPEGGGRDREEHRPATGGKGGAQTNDTRQSGSAQGYNAKNTRGQPKDGRRDIAGKGSDNSHNKPPQKDTFKVPQPVNVRQGGNGGGRGFTDDHIRRNDARGFNRNQQNRRSANFEVGHHHRGMEMEAAAREGNNNHSQRNGHNPAYSTWSRGDKRGNWRFDKGSRGNSPTRQQKGRWSRGSSQSRSSRGNSPVRKNSRPNSRRNSPTNSEKSRTNSPVRHTRVFRRHTSPPSQRSTVSRTPSPPRQRRGGGRGGDSRDLGRGGDSRDLAGWSRGEYRRRDDGLWDPQGKPPSGRIKSAPPSKSHQQSTLPPRFQRNRERDEQMRAGRLDSENSVVSDWSVEVEEEDERRSQSACSPSLPDLSLVGKAGVIRLADNHHHHPHPQHHGYGGGGSAHANQFDMNSSHHQPPHPAWRSSAAAQDQQRLQQQQQHQPEWSQTLPASYSTSNHHHHHQGQPEAGNHHRVLFDPKNPQKPIRFPGEVMVGRERFLGGGDRQLQDYPGPPFSNVRYPLGPSRFSPPTQMLANNLGLQGSTGYRPPFPQSRLLAPQPPLPPFMVAPQSPDWYDVYNSTIYGSTKVDINCIISIVQGDYKLRGMLNEGPAIVCSRWDKEVREARHQIMAAVRELLKSDVFFVAEKEIDSHIWKTVYYQVIEMLKSSYNDTENTTPENRKVLKATLHSLLEEGVDYYNQLLTDLRDVFHVDLERFHDPLEPRDIRRSDRIVLIFAQKYLLCLGDLARYKEQVNATSNYGRARQHYQKANHLDMRNGRPFNMLAILAKLSNRKFETVYYNVRCLMSRNPFQSSKEGLNLIFEEMKRRWEAVEKLKLERLEEEQRSREGSRVIRGTRLRMEVWIRGEGGRRLHRTTSATASANSAQNLDALSVTDLNKRFINTFLHLQGMLFTQINTDDFSLAAESLLEQFRILINKSPLPLSTDRLVQIMALNMYSIEETKLRAQAASSNYRSVMQTNALELAGDMFSILIERCNLLVAAGDPCELLEPLSNRQEEIVPLLAAVKVWCDWLIGNNDTWYPVVSAEPFSQLAQLATRLEAIKPAVEEILSCCLSDDGWNALPQARREEYEIIRLTEDAILCDFEPWFRGLEWATYRQFFPKTVNSIQAENAKRIDQIRICAEVLEGLDPPVLKWSVLDRSHVCLVTDRDESTNASVARDMAEAQLTALIARNEDILEESYSGKEDDEEEALGTPEARSNKLAAAREDDGETEPSGEIARLRVLKEELEKARRVEAMQAQREILAQHVSTTLEIRPKIVVPDTNAFIDHIEVIKQVAQSGEFQMRVPIIVLGELEGLSKSRDSQESRPEHSAMVRENSKQALAWIRQKPANVKCVTTKGSILTSLMVTSEEDSGDAQKNDDKILSCCLAMDTSQPALTEDGMKTVYRNTVLLTDDRNLKLKAHISDCAVSRLKDFVSWLSSQP